MARWRLFPTKTDPVPQPGAVTGTGTSFDTSTISVIFKKIFQYQRQAEPVFIEVAPAADVFPTFSVTSAVQYVKDFIFPSLQEPVPVIAVPPVISVFSVATAMVVATGFMYQALAEPVPVPAAVPAMDSWYQALSEPQRSKKFHPSLIRAERTDTDQTTADRWFIPWSEPLRQKRIATQIALAWSGFAPSAVNDIRWFAPLSEPVRRKPDLIARQHTISTDRDPVVSFGWSDGLSEPVRGRPFLTALQSTLAWSSFTPAAQDIRWFAPLSEPVRVKYLPISQQLAWAGDTDPTVSFGWADKLSEPTRQKQIAERPTLAWSGFTPAAVTDIRWFAPLSEPMRPKRMVGQPALAWSGFTPAEEFQTFTVTATAVTARSFIYRSLVDPVVFAPAVTDIKWFAPLSEPVRQKRGLRADQQQFFAIDLEPTVPFGWADKLSEPVRSKQIAERPALAWSAFTPAPTTDIKWFIPLSEPTRAKRIAEYAAFAWSGFTPAAEEFQTFSVTVAGVTRTPFMYPALAEPVPVNPQVSFSWFGALPEPVRTKPGLLAALQPFFTTDVEPTVSFGWFDRLSEPVRPKPPPWRQALAWGAFTPAAVNDIRWFAPLSEPVRRKPNLGVSQPFFATDAEPTVPFGWFDRLSEPTRPKRIAERPALAWAGFTPAAVADPRWLAPLSEPVRRKRIAEYPGLAWSGFTPAPVTDIKWFAPLSEPTRAKRIAERPAFVWGAFTPAPAATPPATITSEVRFVRDLLYPSLQEPVFFVPPPPVTDIRWFAQLSEPVRIKRGLLAGAQQSLMFTAPFSFAGVGDNPSVFTSLTFVRDLLYPSLQEPVELTVPITIRLDVTETGDVFSGQLIVGFCPQANVSIVEVKAEQANTATAIISTVEAEVSVIEIGAFCERVTVVTTLTDAFGVALTDAFGVALTTVPIVVVECQDDVIAEVSVIELC